jgi:hypothetical protein
MENDFQRWMPLLRRKVVSVIKNADSLVNYNERLGSVTSSDSARVFFYELSNTNATIPKPIPANAFLVNLSLKINVEAIVERITIPPLIAGN